MGIYKLEALDIRHQETHFRVLQKCLKPYQTMLKIRREYPSEQYRQPKGFTEPILGESIYDKSKKLLTNQKQDVPILIWLRKRLHKKHKKNCCSFRLQCKIGKSSPSAF